MIGLELVDDGYLLALADGMGGHAAGEVASRTALNSLSQHANAGTELRELFALANQAVEELAESSPEYLGMGTTLLAILLRGTELTVANVGDSRAYRITAEGITQVTVDHSFIAEAVRSGELSLAEAAASRWKNALTRSIGAERHVEPDIFGPFPAVDDQIFVICSDGVHKFVTPGQILDHCLGTDDVAGAARSIAGSAYRAGSDDNLSVGILEIGRVVRAATPITLSWSVEQQIEKNDSIAPAPWADAARKEAFRVRIRRRAVVGILTATAAAFGGWLAWVLRGGW